MVWGVVEVAGVRLFGKAATNLADARGVFQYSVEPCVVDTRRVKRIEHHAHRPMRADHRRKRWTR